MSMPYAPMTPPQSPTTAEDFTSPPIPAPYPVTLSNSNPTGFDVVVVTAGTGFVFDQTAELYVGDAGVGCTRSSATRDPSCIAARIIARAADGSTVDAVWPQDEMNAVHVTGMASDLTPQFPTLDGETGVGIDIQPTSFAVTVTQATPAPIPRLPECLPVPPH